MFFRLIFEKKKRTKTGNLYIVNADYVCVCVCLPAGWSVVRAETTFQFDLIAIESDAVKCRAGRVSYIGEGCPLISRWKTSSSWQHHVYRPDPPITLSPFSCARAARSAAVSFRGPVDRWRAERRLVAMVTEGGFQWPPNETSLWRRLPVKVFFPPSFSFLSFISILLFFDSLSKAKQEMMRKKRKWKGSIENLLFSTPPPSLSFASSSSYSFSFLFSFSFFLFIRWKKVPSRRRRRSFRYSSRSKRKRLI